jgi:oxygen-independent coproporphyrinogen-3 oxidase
LTEVKSVFTPPCDNFNMSSRDGIPALIERYGGQAPRYTSYPSAAHFRKDAPPHLLTQLLGAMPAGRGVSVYIHIPFCRSLCSYCGCLTRVVAGDGPIQEYASLLRREIEMAGAAAGGRHTVNRIHFGGGTPNLLQRQDLESLLDAVGSAFDIMPGAEIAMEIDPRQMTREKAEIYAAAGINRASLGVQDFQERTQHTINRIQPFEMVAECVSGLRDSGICSVNFDMIYGLPYQSVESIGDNMKKAASLAPDRLAIFGYAHVPWMKPHQKKLERHRLPQSLERFLQEQAARNVLIGKRYIPVGMDHFAREGDSLEMAQRTGTLRRNFQGYTDDNVDVLIGFGVSAISKIGGYYLQNTASAVVYHDRITTRSGAAERFFPLSREDNMRSEIVGSLMCYFSADLAGICGRHNFMLKAMGDSIRKLEAMEDDGLVEINGAFVKVTERGQPFVRAVAACFDTYVDSDEKKYARAV